MTIHTLSFALLAFSNKQKRKIKNEKALGLTKQLKESHRTVVSEW